MKIRCVKNNVFDIKKTDRVEEIFNLSDGQLNLEIDNIYNVHAVVFDKDEPWFYVYLDDDDDYYDYDDTPNSYPASLFELVDSSIPEFWELGLNAVGTFRGAMLSFPEWMNDEQFYLKAINSSPKELKLMNHYRKRVIDKNVEVM